MNMIQKQFDTIYITLGFECNFNCKYCLEEKKKIDFQVPKLSNKLLRFLDNYNYNKTKIMFWGGEPLLYFDSIQKIISRYKEKFTYGTITNGALLSQEIVKYFEENKVSFALSHDGKATKYTRDIDVLKNKKIKNLLLNTSSFTNFSSVYSAVNTNHKELYDFFREQGFENKSVKIDMMYNTKDSKSQIELANIKEDDYVKSLTELFDVYAKNLKRPPSRREKEWEKVHWMINRLERRISEKDEQYENVRVQCRACKTILNLDYDGNVYICHNSTYKIGTVEDSYEKIFGQYKKYLREKYTPKCKTCDFYKYCPGACLLLTEKGQEQYCKLRKIKINMLLNFIIKIKNEHKKREEI